MGGCVVPTCNHRTDGKFKLRNITFHRFPKDPKRRTLWINSLNLDEHVNNEIVTSSDFQKESDAKMVKEITNVDEITITHVRSETNPTSLEVNLPLTQEKETMTKIRKLHQSLRRKSNYIETLTSALDELKKERLLNDEQVEILQNLGEPVTQIIKRQLNRKLNLSVDNMSLH
ncbi:thap domain-containing protein 6-like protein [Lasius niger]|uniref:Thap domain-containing protein 6-like protein n=1 Tax=Lasius niger TaxID=67767 RepID=A0A0J7KR88_LASNI|nr:thap domain-containing protein 6-like protein [Lasius niger]